jgi:Maintenance of mitochondrial structure and function
LTGTASSQSSTSTQPIADLEIVESSIQSTMAMLDRVLSYVQAVLSGEKQGDAAIGRYLMDTLGASTDDLEKGGFNSSLQVALLTPPAKSIDRLMWDTPSGYLDGFIPSKPCSFPSRSLFTIGTGICTMIYQFYHIFLPKIDRASAIEDP